MTKQKALSLAKELDVKCDESYMFCVKVGSGCLTSVKTAGSAQNLLTLFINMLERMSTYLKENKQDEARELLLRALQMYLEDDKPAPRRENISDKQRRKRRKTTELIISQIESVL